MIIKINTQYSQEKYKKKHAFLLLKVSKLSMISQVFANIDKYNP